MKEPHLANQISVVVSFSCHLMLKRHPATPFVYQVLRDHVRNFQVNRWFATLHMFSCFGFTRFFFYIPCSISLNSVARMCSHCVHCVALSFCSDWNDGLDEGTAHPQRSELFSYFQTLSQKIDGLFNPSEPRKGSTSCRPLMSLRTTPSSTALHVLRGIRAMYGRPFWNLEG